MNKREDIKTYEGYVTSLEEHQVFCYGSNPEGRHGAGTARIALLNGTIIWYCNQKPNT